MLHEPRAANHAPLSTIRCLTNHASAFFQPAGLNRMKPAIRKIFPHHPAKAETSGTHTIQGLNATEGIAATGRLHRPQNEAHPHDKEDKPPERLA
jgi:hypothetical protein